MKESVTRGTMSLHGPCGLVYDIGTLTYTVREDESFRYVFTPNWPVIDLLGPPSFQGVPGFDLSQCKNEYVRENLVPTFVSERAPAENREDLWQLLEANGMEYLDQLEWLIRTDTRYIGDDLFMRADQSSTERVQINAEEVIARSVNCELATKEILEAFCSGADVVLRGAVLTANERKAMHATLLGLYVKAYGQREKRRIESVRAAAKRGAYSGRKRKPVDELLLREAVARYEAHEVDAEDAAGQLGISVSTFYRRLKELRTCTVRD